MTSRTLPHLPLFRHVIQPLIEFIYPPACFVCATPLKGSTSRVCPACWSTLRAVTENDSLFQEMSDRLIEEGHIARLISLYHFEKEGALQSMIHQLKYDGMTSLGVELGRRLGAKLLAESARTKIDGIIPVPLHTTARRERGYNQSEYIARGVREVTRIPVYDSLLRRHKHTSSQTQLTAIERKENVGDAFSVNKKASADVKDKVFLIVDDVVTTGATIGACAEVLKECGASDVVACSVALAVHSASP